MEHIWTMLMHKILQNHLLCAFVAHLKIDAIYALDPESFCGINLAIQKVFAFSDSAPQYEAARCTKCVTTGFGVQKVQTSYKMVLFKFLKPRTEIPK